jgi:MtN3 and saliva related transmembrane protein
MAEVVGWTSSLILLVTIAKQVHKQWRDKQSEGVSVWLFVGQLMASAGFTIYSCSLGNWVFVVTNVLMALGAGIGLILTLFHRRAWS